VFPNNRYVRHVGRGNTGAQSAPRVIPRLDIRRTLGKSTRQAALLESSPAHPTARLAFAEARRAVCFWPAKTDLGQFMGRLLPGTGPREARIASEDARLRRQVQGAAPGGLPPRAPRPGFLGCGQTAAPLRRRASDRDTWPTGSLTHHAGRARHGSPPAYGWERVQACRMVIDQVENVNISINLDVLRYLGS